METQRLRHSPCLTDESPTSSNYFLSIQSKSLVNCVYFLHTSPTSLPWMWLFLSLCVPLLYGSSIPHPGNLEWEPKCGHKPEKQEPWELKTSGEVEWGIGQSNGSDAAAELDIKHLQNERGRGPQPKPAARQYSLQDSEQTLGTRYFIISVRKLVRSIPGRFVHHGNHVCVCVMFLCVYVCVQVYIGNMKCLS